MNDGENWYDLILEPRHWFNGGMPVAPHNHFHLLEDKYEGSGDVLLYLYHPNLWITARGYKKSDELGLGIFEAMGWRKDWLSAASLYPKWLAKEAYKVGAGYSCCKEWGGKRYYFNATYCYLDPSANRQLVDTVMADLNLVFARFKKVVVVRTPIKEELAADLGYSGQLERLADNYDVLWRFFCDSVDDHVSVAELPTRSFGALDYHPFDTHWTRAGNLNFARQVRDICIREGIDTRAFSDGP